MKLRYTPRAAAELDDLLVEIANHSPRGASRVQARIKAVADQLIEHPNRGKLTSLRGVRRVLTLPYPYLIFYAIADQDVIIIGIRHGARAPNTMPK